MTEDSDSLITVGWREYVDLPDWGILGVLAKIDTGAKTSSLHVDNIEEIGEGRLRFEVVLSRTNPDLRMPVEAAEVVRTAVVRPSTGRRQERHVVSTAVRLGGVEKTAEFTLVDRGQMLCRMLAGRELLAGSFIVDSGRRYIHGRPKRKRRRKRAAK